MPSPTHRLEVLVDQEPAIGQVVVEPVQEVAQPDAGLGDVAVRLDHGQQTVGIDAGGGGSELHLQHAPAAVPRFGFRTLTP